MSKKQKSIAWYNDIEDKRVVLLQSGGLDSCVLAHVFKYFNFEIHHIFVDYGQNMVEKERQYSKAIVEKVGGTYEEVKISLPWLKDSTSLVGDVVDDTHVTNPQFNANLSGVYVPMRNHMLLSIAGSYAEAKEIPYIACAFDGAEDKKHVPTGGTTDKHPTFVKKIEQSLNEGSSFHHILNKNFTILTPVMGLFKPEIIGLGLACDTDFSLSWSCYNKGEVPCGECSACKLRAQAFRELEMLDPAIPHIIGVDYAKGEDKTAISHVPLKRK